MPATVNKMLATTTTKPTPLLPNGIPYELSQLSITIVVGVSYTWTSRLPTCEAIWLKRLLLEHRLNPQCISLHCDNLGRVKLSQNPTFHSLSKQFDSHLHFIREKVQKGEIEVLQILTDQQPADILTKTLRRIKFKKCRDLLRVLPVPNT